MKTYCSYHPTKPAQWECPNCNDNFCPKCITKREVETYGKKKSYFFCSKCDGQVNKLAIGNVIPPFWIRLPKLFIYPFHLRSLILMFVLAFASVLFAGSGLVKFLLQIAIWGVLLKYSFAALKDTSIGKLVPPKITLEVVSDNFQVVFKQLGIYVAIFLAFFKIAQVAGMPIALLFLCFMLLSIPAMITVLAVTDSLISALNPLIFVKMAWRIGWGYLLMYVFLLLLLFAPAVLGQYIIAFLPKGLYLFLLSLAKSYYMIISYHLMGYIMLQYHEEIGWQVDFDDDFVEENKGSGAGSGNELLNRVDMLIKDGQIASLYIGPLSEDQLVTRIERLLAR